MKEVILSADGFRYVYSVPDKVAENLYEYCIEFCKWLNDSPDAKKFRRKTKTGTVLSYTEEDFINYLNQYLFPDEYSKYVANLGYSIPQEYRDIPHFNF